MPTTSCALKSQLLDSGLSVSQLVFTAWASASTFRNSDKRGGANGARIRLEPQRSWAVNEPETLVPALGTLEGIQQRFNDSQRGGKKISLADLIVLGGCAAIEQAAARAGHDIEVPFRPGRTDATQEWTDVEWFAALEPTADAFRNYVGVGTRLPPELPARRPREPTDPERPRDDGAARRPACARRQPRPIAVGRVHLDTGLADERLLHQPPRYGHRMGTEDGQRREPTTFEGRDRRTGEVKWIASRVDLAFRANSELRALSEVYASQDAEEKFVRDFVSAWDKVMNLDLFDQA